MRTFTGMIVAGMLAAATQADEITVPSATAEAPGDLAAPAFWGGAAPAADADWRFNTADGVYTASDDVTALSLTWTKPTTIDLSATPTRRFWLGPAANATPAEGAIFPGGARTVDIYQNNCGALTLLGGIYDCGGWDFNCTKGWNRGTGSKIVLDGSTVTNVRNMTIHYGQPNAVTSTLEMRNGARLYLSKGAYFFLNTGPGYFKMTDGSYLIADELGQLDYLKFSEKSYGAEFYFAGADTVFTNAGNAAELIYNAVDMRFTVTDGATVALSDTRGFGDGSTNSEFNVLNGSKLMFKRTFWCPYGSLVASNRVNVLGGTLETSGRIEIRGPDTTFVFSNATVKAMAFSWQSAATNTTFIFKGNKNVFRRETKAPFFGADRGRLVYDGATIADPIDTPSLYFAAGRSSGNTLELINRSDIAFEYVKFQCYAWFDDYPGTTNNTVRVADDSHLRANSFTFSFNNNALVITNGTVHLASSGSGGSAALNVEAGPEGAFATTNNMVVLQGDHPRLEALQGGGIYSRHGLIWRFELPESGFTPGVACVIAKKYGSDGTAHFVFTGVEACRRKLKKATQMTLFETDGNPGATPFNEDEFARLQAALPANKRVRAFRQDGKIILELKPDKGTLLLMR